MWIKKKDYSHIFLSFLYVIIQIHCVFLFVVVLKKPRILQEVIKKLLKTTEIITLGLKEARMLSDPKKISIYSEKLDLIWIQIISLEFQFFFFCSLTSLVLLQLINLVKNFNGQFQLLWLQ